MAETFLYVALGAFTSVSVLVCYRYWLWYQEVKDECDIGSLRCKLLRDELLEVINERIKAAEKEPSGRVPRLLVHRYPERRYDEGLEKLKAMNEQTPEETDER
jgi:hypothetical protein